MNKWVILALVFSFSLVNADSFTGYVNGNFGRPVSLSAGTGVHDCENYSDPGDCHIAQSGAQKVCFGSDTFSASYTAYQDHIGDIARNCRWASHPTQGQGCYNFVEYGGAFPPSGSSPGFDTISCFYGTPSDSNCNWVVGSFVARSGYCQLSGLSMDILYPTSRQDCGAYGDTWGRNYFSSNGVNYQLPSVSNSHSKGVCFDTCEEVGSSVIDYELCTPGSSYKREFTSAFAVCPRTQRDDACLNSAVLRDYSCDGSPMYSPGDVGYGFLDSNSMLDGTDAVYVDTDCSVLFPSASPECNPLCGSLAPGAGQNVCISAKEIGECDSGSCVEGARKDLDNSQTVLNQFLVDCGSFGGNVQWVQGASFGEYGGYNVGLLWVNQNYPPIPPWDTVSDRTNFPFEVCGDDESEYNIGSYCCDNADDYIDTVVDNVPSDPLDMNGDYCINNGGCGDGIVSGTELCDARYVLYSEYNLSGLGFQEYRKVFGNDSACSAGFYCTETCDDCVVDPTYNVTPSCDNGTIDPGEDCDGSDLNGQDCSSQGWDDGVLDCYPLGHANECTFNVSGCYNITTGPGPDPVEGPDEYIIYGLCSDDGDDDEYGEMNWTIYDNAGLSVNNGVTSCILDRESIPGFSLISFLIFINIIFGFYYLNKKVFK